MPESRTSGPAVGRDARVTHPDFGAGTVRGLVRGGRVARVEFDRMPGTPWEIPVHELRGGDPEAMEALARAAVAITQGSAATAEQQAEPPVASAATAGQRAKPPIASAATAGHQAKPPVASAATAEQQAEPPVASAATAGQQAKPPVASAAEDLDERQARQAIEALRLGVVPAHHLETYTVGRDAELAVVRQDLLSSSTDAAQGGGLRVLLGDYGAGKTHTLELVAQLALEAGYLVGVATLDSRETKPSHPRRIYHQIARGLRYPGAPDRPAGLAPLLTEAARDADRVLAWAGLCAGGGAPHPYLGPALLYHAALVGEPGQQEQALHDRLLDWIEGAEVASNRELNREVRLATGLHARLWALQDHRTVTHLYTLLLGGIACLAREVGYAGLVVLVDEAEFYSVLGSAERALSRVLFQTLAAASLRPEALRFDPASLPRGGQAAHRRLPHRFHADQPLYTVLALTHDPEGLDMLGDVVRADHFLELRPFDTADFVTLSERALALYRRARLPLEPGSDLPHLLATVMEACHRRGLIENPRQALKFVTEVVDVARLSPARVKPLLAELKQRFLAGRPAR